MRRKGQVPPGARPLEAPSAALGAPAALPAPVVYRWTAPIVERGDSVPESASTASVDDVEDSERLGTGSRANADDALHGLDGDGWLTCFILAAHHAEYRSAHDHGDIVHRHAEAFVLRELPLDHRGHIAAQKLDIRARIPRCSDRVNQQ